MNPRITQLADRLGELTADEMTELGELLVSEVVRLDTPEASPAEVAEMGKLAGIAERLSVRRARSAAAALAQPAPVTAAGRASGAVARLANRRRPQGSPEAGNADGVGRAVLVASGSLDGVGQGKPVSDRYELAKAMARTLDRMSKSGPPRGPVTLASVTVDYPGERQLGDDLMLNTRRIESACSPDALVATGGICLPVNVDYSVPTWATAERPLRDGLPGYQASRGGVRYMKPPDIGEWAAATGIWTEATDAEPGMATKPVVSMSCGAEELVYVEAVSTRLGFGNMQSRFAPEAVAANTDLAMAAAARIAENNLLSLIAEQAIKDVTSATLIGATRDLLTAVSQVAAGLRSLHRLPDSGVITGIFPRWVRDLMRIDLAREIGHSQNSDWNALAVTDEQIEDLLLVHGVHPIWHLDGQPELAGKYPAQVFGEQEHEHAVNPFPTKCVWYAHPEGAVQFLDAGRLDLGVVRDSTLDATNDYETFVETFEGIANRGFTGGILQMVSTLCASGATAGTISTAGDCA